MEGKWEGRLKEKEAQIDLMKEELDNGQKEIRNLMHDKNTKKNHIDK